VFIVRKKASIQLSSKQLTHTNAHGWIQSRYLMRSRQPRYHFTMDRQPTCLFM